MAGRKPDYRLSALIKSTEHKGNVGAAWLNEDGTLSIKLNDFVCLEAKDNLLLTLFPADKDWNNKYFSKKNATKQTESKVQRADSDNEQPVPF